MVMQNTRFMFYLITRSSHPLHSLSRLLHSTHANRREEIREGRKKTTHIYGLWQTWEFWWLDPESDLRKPGRDDRGQTLRTLDEPYCWTLVPGILERRSIPDGTPYRKSLFEGAITLGLKSFSNVVSFRNSFLNLNVFSDTNLNQ